MANQPGKSSMRNMMLVGGLLLVGSMGVLAEERESPAAAAKRRSETAKLLDEAEPRIKEIFKRRALSALSFHGKWSKDGSGYLLLEPRKPTAERDVVHYDAESGKRTVLIGAEQLKVPETASRVVIGEFAELPISGRFLLHGGVEPAGPTNSGYWQFDVKSSALRAIKEDIGGIPAPEMFSPGCDRILFHRGQKLMLFDLNKEKTVTLTGGDGGGTLSHDQMVSWSPDGKRVVYVEADSSKVRVRKSVKTDDPTYPSVRQERFSRVGTPIPSLRVGVVSAEGGETKWVKLPSEPGTFYLRNVHWAGNSDELFIDMFSRYRDVRTLLIANVNSGAVQEVYKETNRAWVDAALETNGGVEWIHGGQDFILLSERGGWRQAYIFARDGKKQTLLTKEASDIIQREPVDEKGGWFYYLASPENATQRYLYRIRLDGKGEAERVTPAGQPGTHTYEFSPDCQWAFHTYSTFDTPPVTDLVTLPEHRVVRQLESNAQVRKRLESWITRPTEFLKLKIGDGVVMDAWIIKPRDFDAKKKYPLFVFVYGEPADQTVLDDWHGGQGLTLFHRVVADLGYLVVSMDNRGTPAPKGAEWRRASFPMLGPLSTEEQAAGVKELGRMLPYVDLSRVGIWGWSGGGSNTLNAMFRKPEVYQVGIAVAPKPQPWLYNSWFQEIYTRTLEDNAEGYKKSAPINFAEGLRGSLLILHGTGETNTHVQITEGLIDRLIELGKRFDYMSYPNRDHGLQEGRGTEVHVMMLIIRYLVEHLPPGPG